MYKRIGLFLFPLLAVPLFAHAALVNINTADIAELDTLPGIGPSKAQALVEYRNANGPFATKEDIQNVSGIGYSTYDGIKDFITIGDATASVTSTTGEDKPEESAPSSGGGSTTDTTIPLSSLSVDAGGDRLVMRDVAAIFSATLRAKGGSSSESRVFWSFGDGSKAEGRIVEKIYRYAGTYVVVATAINGSVIARDEFVVTVEPVSVHIGAVTGEGVLIVNNTDTRLDLSQWLILSDKGSFRIPEGMTILPEASVLIPFSVMQMPVSYGIALAYPSGLVAVSYEQRVQDKSVAVSKEQGSLMAQPSHESSGSTSIQTVEPIINQPSSQDHESTAVVAPATVAQPTVAGAALALDAENVVASPHVPTEAPAIAPSSSAFRSPWTLGFVGVIALAAGAFIIL